MREVGWVVFDEVHYLRDKSRGVVWEETIILLPDKVRYVFLSATIPNAMQFAEWITKTHKQPCHVVYTDFRPTPLQHYFFPEGADGIHLVVDEKGTFREENFQKAMASITEKAGTAADDFLAKRKGQGKDKKTNKGGNKEQSDIYKIVKMIMLKNYNPVIVFSFSKRECENYALAMSQLAFNDESEKAMVSKVFGSAIEMLSEEDRSLAQIQNILPLLRRGIGVHHSGLLPILKETIEILFQEGLIKVLFATETFSIGLNMPAKTVVFTSVRKFDGVSERWVTPSEFIQMSGRAGRRGLDERGIVIMMINEQMEPAVAKEIVRGQQDNLNSAFHLGYNMILNLLRVEGISPEFMLERCFSQFQNTASVSNLEKKLRELEIERETMVITDEPAIRAYYNIREQIKTLTKEIRDVIQQPDYCLQFLQRGRLVKIKYEEHDFGWGAVLNYWPRKAEKGEKFRDQDAFILDCALVVASDTKYVPHSNNGLPPGIRPPPSDDKGKVESVPVLLSAMESIGHLRIFLPDDLKHTESKVHVKHILDQVMKRFPDPDDPATLTREQVKKRFPDGIAILDPIENMKIQDEGFKRTLRVF